MKKRKFIDRLQESPINYFSDLFIIAMVVAWIVVLLVMMGVGIYSARVLHDTSIWSDIGTLVAVPLSCGGGIWMIKNSVQHAIRNNRGESCPYDFPRVNAEGEEDGNEEIMEFEGSEE
jgi:hypothetical protein